MLRDWKTILLRCDLATNCYINPISSQLKFQQGFSFFFFLLEIDKLILKFIWKYKGHRVAKTILKKNEVWSLENSYCYFIILTQKLQKPSRYRIDIMTDI